MEPLGQFCAANCFWVQMVTMFSWARKIFGGRVTVALPMFASPRRGRTIALRVGLSPRPCGPFKVSESGGPKPRPEQLDAWNGTGAAALESSEGSEKRAPAPVSVELTTKGSHEVGLTISFGLSM